MTTAPLHTRTPAAQVQHHGLMAVVRAFTPNWFTVNMGTGIVSLMLPHLPVPGSHAAGQALWFLNMALIVLFTALSVARMALFPREVRATLHHPVQSMFLGAVPMGLATVINGFITFGLPLWGEGAATLARDLWVLDAALSAVVGLLLPYLMFTRQEHSLNAMTAVWLLPMVASEVAAASAGLIAPHVAAAWAAPMLYTGYVLFALSVPIAFMIMTVLVLRLAQHKLPAADLGVSMFLPLGPLATGALALLQLGEAAPRILAAEGLGQFAAIFEGVGLLGGLVLWGFGAWWLVLATLTTIRYLRGGLPFNLGWWGFTFPLGVYTAATYGLAALTHQGFFTVLGNVLASILTLLWLTVAARTIHGAALGKLFVMPALSKETGAPVK